MGRKKAIDRYPSDLPHRGRGAYEAECSVLSALPSSKGFIMSSLVGQPLTALDSPQLLLDLDVIDANLGPAQAPASERGVDVRVHFKSLKCGGLARYLADARAARASCAPSSTRPRCWPTPGITDILVANQIVGPLKLGRLAELAKRVHVCVCVDDADNVAQMGQAAPRRRRRPSACWSRWTSAWTAAASSRARPALPLARADRRRDGPALRRPAGLRRPPAAARRPGRAQGEVLAGDWSSWSARAG